MFPRPARSIAVTCLLAGCATAPPRQSPLMPSAAGPAASAARAEVDAWHAERLERLAAEDGSLTFVALDWLDEGTNAIGRSAACRVRYEGFPEDVVGTIVREGDALRFEAAPGVDVGGAPEDGVLRTDADGAPTVLTAGTCTFFVIDRGGRLGVRVKDSNAATRRDFAGIPRYPFDPAWRIEAAFVPAAPEASLAFDLVVGVSVRDDLAGHAEFTMDGADVRLALTSGGAPDRCFLVFGDETNGRETYGGGRFLVAERTPDGRVILDFNRAYTPPCAFTPYATCPLPPPGNRLPFAVRAGERFAAHE